MWPRTNYISLSLSYIWNLSTFRSVFFSFSSTSLYFLRFYLICPTCFHKWPRVCSTYVTTFQSFPHPILITGIVTRVIRRVPLVQQNCWSLRSTWVHIRFLVGFVLLCYCNTLLIVDYPFVLSLGLNMSFNINKNLNN